MDTFDLNDISFEGNLSDQDVFDDINLVAGLLIGKGSASETYAFARSLEQILRKSQNLGSNKEKYSDLLVRLYLNCLQVLADKDLENLLKHHLTAAFRERIDLRSMVSLIFAPAFDQKDFDTLSRISRYLDQNDEVVGKDNISIPENQNAAPLISNWLKDYKSVVTQDNGSLNIANYVSKSKNITKLNEDESNFIKYVLNFYDWLRFQTSKVSFVPSEIVDNSQTQERIVSLEQKMATPIPPKVSPSTAPKAPVKEMTAFEKRLADVSAGNKSSSSYGLDLGTFKQRVAETQAPAPTKPAVPSPTEIKREVETKELPAYKVANEIKPVPPKPVIKSAPIPPPPIAISKPSVPRVKPVSYFEATLSDIKSIDDLKKVSLSHLRRGPIETQVEQFKSKIIDLSRSNKVMPYYALKAFEESPLFRAYLNHGNSVVAGGANPSELTREEFEAVADLRREIQRL